MVDTKRKRELLFDMMGCNKWQQVLLFTRTKHGANYLAEQLNKEGITAAAIHGNKSQGARTRALADFKPGSIRVLVASDIATRGLDIDLLPHLVNSEPDQVAEDYVQRISRTSRAAETGEALSLVCADELSLLRDIERLLKSPFRASRYRAMIRIPASKRSRSSRAAAVWAVAVTAVVILPVKAVAAAAMANLAYPMRQASGLLLTPAMQRWSCSSLPSDKRRMTDREFLFRRYMPQAADRGWHVFASTRLWVAVPGSFPPLLRLLLVGWRRYACRIGSDGKRACRTGPRASVQNK